MGGGSWTTTAYANYAESTGKSYDAARGILSKSMKAQDIYKKTCLDESLNPYGVVRECCDSEEHPNTIPVILALDVTGSMGQSLERVAQRLNTVMTKLYSKVDDVEIMIMGIGDLAYDDAPIQASQFESDIRIAESLDNVWFERGGGGNAYESYTAAWYFGLHHTKLDCWKRGKKGIIITLGDEPLNPYLPSSKLKESIGGNFQADIDTKALYKNACEKFDIHHIAVDDSDNCFRGWEHEIIQTWGDILDKDHFHIVNLDQLIGKIIQIVEDSSKGQIVQNGTDEHGGITW